jgi:hypothetical protein
MRIDRRLTLIGILLVILSMTMATQYATTKIGYSYGIIHPSDSAIRFIGSDNSTDGIRVLRIRGDNTTQARVHLEFGNLSANVNKTYSAAFGIVNEEPFAINITHINVSAGSPGSQYMQIWLHCNPAMRASEDTTSVLMFNKGENTTWNEVDWTLARGDQDPSTKHVNVSDDATIINTPWDPHPSARVRYSVENAVARHANRSGNPENTLDYASDFVWVQVSIDLPALVDREYFTGGTIWIHFEATTLYGEP